jgi:hypothetical protein
MGKKTYDVKALRKEIKAHLAQLDAPNVKQTDFVAKVRQNMEKMLDLTAEVCTMMAIEIETDESDEPDEPENAE